MVRRSNCPDYCGCDHVSRLQLCSLVLVPLFSFFSVHWYNVGRKQILLHFVRTERVDNGRRMFYRNSSFYENDYDRREKRTRQSRLSSNRIQVHEKRVSFIVCFSCQKLVSKFLGWKNTRNTRICTLPPRLETWHAGINRIASWIEYMPFSKTENQCRDIWNR